MLLTIWQIYNLFYFVIFYIHIYRSGRKINPYWIFATALINVFISLFYIAFI